MSTTSTTKSKPAVLSCGTITGDSVRNSQGEDLGTIKEIMVDVDNGRVAYAVLSFGGILGFGEKLFAVPFSALKLCPDEHKFLLDVDKEQLERAHGFDKDDWPDMADRKWQTEVHDLYGSKPYWESPAHYQA